jgi:hypothetical protein
VLYPAELRARFSLAFKALRPAAIGIHFLQVAKARHC